MVLQGVDTANGVKSSDQTSWDLSQKIDSQSWLDERGSIGIMPFRIWPILHQKASFLIPAIAYLMYNPVRLQGEDLHGRRSLPDSLPLSTSG